MSDAEVEALARTLYLADPVAAWPQRWGWVEMPQAKKDRYLSMARALAGQVEQRRELS